MKPMLSKFKSFLNRENDMGLDFRETYLFNGVLFSAVSAVFVGVKGNILLSLLLLVIAVFFGLVGLGSVARRRGCKREGDE